MEALKSAVLPRCRVCRLPGGALQELHRDRLVFHLTLEELVQKARESGYKISDSGLRRHFRHAPALSDRTIPAWKAEPPASAEDTPTAFDALLGRRVNERVVLEATTQALIEKIQRAEREWKSLVARSPQAAEKALAKYTKLQTALERSLKQLREARQLREELDAIVMKIGGALGDGILDGGQRFMRTSMEALKSEFNAYLANQASGIGLVRKLDEFEREWAAALGRAVSDAVSARVSAIPELRQLEAMI